MKKTETAQTAHGKVKYKVVKCSSCGQYVREENARPFKIGDSDYQLHDRFDLHKHMTGYACQSCSEDPIAFPRFDSFIERLQHFINNYVPSSKFINFLWVTYAIVSAVVWILFAILLIVLIA